MARLRRRTTCTTYSAHCELTVGHMEGEQRPPSRLCLSIVMAAHEAALQEATRSADDGGEAPKARRLCAAHTCTMAAQNCDLH